MFEIQIQIGLTKSTVRVIDRLSDAILAFAGKKTAADDFDIVKDEDDSAAIPAAPEPEPVKTEHVSKKEPAKREPEEAPEPTKPAKEEVPPEEPGVDYDKIREEIVSIIQANIRRSHSARAVIKEKFKAYSVNKPADLQDSQLEDFLAELEQAVSPDMP